MRVEQLDPLPIALKGTDEESGFSFIFRTLHANALSLRDAQHWLEIKFWRSISDAEFRRLAWVLRVERTWLAYRTVIPLGKQSPRQFGLMGHKVGQGFVDHSHSSRLCPACVKSRKFGKISWLIRPVFGCVEHETVLMDRCPRCQVVIGWNRPAIDLCVCGHFLTSADPEKQPLSPSALNWLQWTEARFSDNAAVVPAAGYGLPALLDALTIDGAFRTVLAIGLLDSATDSVSRATSRTQGSSGMSEAITRGLDRLSSLENSFDRFQALEPIIHLPILERMRTQSQAPEDANCATLLIDWIRSGARSSRPEKRGAHPRGQLPLFPC